LGASHPLLPVHYVAVTALVGFPDSWSGAVGRLGVGVLGCWRGGSGSVRRGRLVAGGRRLVVARPLRGRGFFLVLRIRCCPSTTWPSLPWSASLARGRGRSAAWRPRWPVAMPRLAAPHGSRSLLGTETGSRRDSQGLGRCVTCGFARHPHLRRPASAGFVLSGPKPRHDKTKRAARRRRTQRLTHPTGATRADKPTPRTETDQLARGRNACAAAEHPDAPRTTAPDRESGDAVQGSDGHVVDGQQRMRSTKQRPRPRRGRATTRRWQPPRPGPAERTRGHRAPAQQHDAQCTTAPTASQRKPSRVVTAT
ncbi:hypothetical protein ABIA38_008395, partial [Embleya sp. AB8]